MTAKERIFEHMEYYRMMEENSEDAKEKLWFCAKRQGLLEAIVCLNMDPENREVQV